ncbi:MAG TPA: HAD hydrolase-like protein [Tepidiformaceae bacterium]|nr:HAD hydrolase-like protein [Tepidiformaceae bacterium]
MGASGYRHIIWDWNGTVLDDVDVVVDVMNVLLERRSMPALTTERYLEVFDFPVRVYYEAVGFDLEREPFAMLAAEWIETFQGRWRTGRIRDGAPGVIRSLGARGVGCSVLSAAEQNLLLEQAGHFEVRELFDGLVGIDDHHAESKVEHGLRWIEGLDVRRDQVLLVGDTNHDVEVAAALGVDVVLVEGGHQSAARLRRSGARVVGSFGELLGAL